MPSLKVLYASQSQHRFQIQEPHFQSHHLAKMVRTLGRLIARGDEDLDFFEQLSKHHDCFE